LELTFQFLPPSARYLVGAGRKREALKILETISKLNKTKLPAGELVPEMQVFIKSNIYC
jgi:hypothetical protein